MALIMTPCPYASHSFPYVVTAALQEEQAKSSHLPQGRFSLSYPRRSAIFGNAVLLSGKEGSISYRTASGSRMSCEEINMLYRNHCYPFSLLPFDTSILAILDDYIELECKSVYAKSVYALAPDIINPQLPLERSLRPLSYGSQTGDSGRVSFFHSIHDGGIVKWFAVKEPARANDLVGNFQGNPESRLKEYHHNIEIAARIGDHSSFMKVAGIVVKGTIEKFTPYLILDKIEGETLKTWIEKRALSSDDIDTLLIQFTKAMTFLFKKNICPQDIHLENLLCIEDKKRKEKQLKFIDFDEWRMVSDQALLAEELCRYSKAFMTALMEYEYRRNEGNHPRLSPLPHDVHNIAPYSLHEGEDSETSLIAYLDELIAYARMHLSIYV